MLRTRVRVLDGRSSSVALVDSTQHHLHVTVEWSVCRVLLDPALDQGAGLTEPVLNQQLKARLEESKRVILAQLVQDCPGVVGGGWAAACDLKQPELEARNREARRTSEGLDVRRFTLVEGAAMNELSTEQDERARIARVGAGGLREEPYRGGRVSGERLQLL
jgi:hypothetical protein